MGGKLKGPLPKSISTMVEFHTMYWTCPQCGIDFAVLVLHGIDKGEVPVSWNACKLVEVTGGRNTDFRERPFQLSLLVMDDNWYNLLRNYSRKWLLRAGVYLERRTI